MNVQRQVVIERAAKKHTKFWQEAAKDELHQGADAEDFIVGAVHADLSHAVCVARSVLRWSREEWTKRLLAAWDEDAEMERLGMSGWNS